MMCARSSSHHKPGEKKENSRASSRLGKTAVCTDVCQHRSPLRCLMVTGCFSSGCHAPPDYSQRSASTGFTRMALLAGT
jgi:hypothetical protein